MNALHISSSPHLKTSATTNRIMLDVIISLLPALIAGVIIFGSGALLVVGVCIAACVLSEYLFNLILKREQTIGDLSACVTGLLLGLNLNANTPIWQAVVGSFFSIVVVKCIFGGLGKNVVNPAITGRVFMLVAFSSLAAPAFPLDSTATATPLATLNPEILGEGVKNSESLIELFLGTHGGAIGETCALALILGGIYLLVRKVITFHIPLVFALTVFGFSFALSGDFILSLKSILAGGFLIGAIFMATDYVTSPASSWGKVVFAFGAGIITCLVRFWGSYPEGVSYGILLMNILTPYIEKITNRKLFGGAKR